MQKGPWEVLNQYKQALGWGQRWRRELTGRIPAREVAGGEGQGAREHEGLEAHLLVYLGGRRMAGGGSPALGQCVAAGVNGDGDAPAWEQWREVAG